MDWHYCLWVSTLGLEASLSNVEKKMDNVVQLVVDKTLSQ